MEVEIRVVETSPRTAVKRSILNVEYKQKSPGSFHAAGDLLLRGPLAQGEFLNSLQHSSFFKPLLF
ncbi:MAG: hypothetical protein AAGU75_25245 [Bacillota bacterium]